MATKTAVNGIVIPSEFVELASQYYSGQTDLLYAVASTGNLTTVNRKPIHCETDEQWYLYLYQQLSADVSAAVRLAKRDKADDLERLEFFEAWVDKTVEILANEYGLADWEYGE